MISDMDQEVFERIDSVEGYAGFSSRLLDVFRDARIFALHGPMGVGKTTLIKYLCSRLGVTGVVTSPSFSIVNEYVTTGFDAVYHFDFYRIKKIEEVYDLGYEEYFFSGRYCFIEWPEKLGTLLPEGCVKIFMEDIGGERVIRV